MSRPETSMNTQKKPPDKFKCCENFDNYSNEGSSLIDHLSSHLTAINSFFDNDLSQGGSSHLTAINSIFDDDLSQTIKKGEFTSVSSNAI